MKKAGALRMDNISTLIVEFIMDAKKAGYALSDAESKLLHLSEECEKEKARDQTRQIENPVQGELE